MNNQAMTVLIVLAITVFLLLVIVRKSPIQQSSSAPTRWHNVHDYGAVGDGLTDDTAALQAAINDTPDGAGVYFPVGIYLVNATTGLAVTSRYNLRLLGDGWGSIIKRHPSASGSARLMAISGGGGITLRDLAFDVNGIDRYGGIAIDNTHNLLVTHCHAFDSALTESWITYDHYWLVIQNSEHIVLSDSLAEDIELIEVDNNRHVTISNNTSLRAAGYGAIIWASVNNGYYAEDYTIVGNTIIDPRKRGIGITHEASGLNNNIVTRINIIGNTIIQKDIAGHYAIVLGNLTGLASTGNVFSNITLQDNRIIIENTEHALGAIFFMHNQPNAFSRVRIIGNSVTAPSTALAWLIEVRRAQNVDIANNVVYGGSYGFSLNGVADCNIHDNSIYGTPNPKYLGLGGLCLQDNNRW